MEESDSEINLQELSNDDQDEAKKKEEREKQKFAEELMDTIQKGDVEEIKVRINPRTLTKCKNNTLYMAMKASSELRRRANEKEQDEEEFTKLANSVDEFSCSLLNPLKSDKGLLYAFANSLDQVIDYAIEMKQKKILAHPVLRGLLNNKWLGEFGILRGSSWLSIQYWKWCFLNIWCVFDLLLFPVLFFLFYIIHICRDKGRKQRGVDGKSIYDSYRDYFTTPYFVFIRDALSYLVLLGLHFTICLETSSISFTWIECAILVFFTGRVLFECEQFTNKKVEEAVKKITRHCRRMRCNQGCRYHEDDVETQEEETKPQGFTLRFSKYITDRWNILDLITLIIFFTTFLLRMVTLALSDSVTNNRSLVIVGYFYGLNAMFLTLRAFGHVMETTKQIGPIQIALFHILIDIATIFWQFIATILAFSIAITKVYVAEKSFISDDNGKELVCSSSGIACWWKMVRHLYWSLLGAMDVDLLDSADDPSVILANALYGAFLVMGVILLINMMIALLSNTYQKVQDNSLMEWSFKKAITIQTYSSCHPIPVPVNLISLLFKCCGCISCKNRKQHTQTTRKVNLDAAVKKLEFIYFAKYGYLFPLTDERKLDRILLETERNRQMANQIAQRTFTASHSSDENVLPTGPQAWVSRGISVEECLLTCEGANPFDGARYVIPFSPTFPHFQVLIQETGDRRFLGIGAVWEGYEVSSCMPGWLEGTVGYHIDDGKIFHAENPYIGKEVEDAMAYRGDLIGCTIKFEEKTNGKVPVVFTLNGRRITEDKIWIDYTPGGKQMYPYIAMSQEGMRVLAKMRPSREIPDQQQIFPTITMEKGSRSSDLQLEQLVNAMALDYIKEMKETIDANYKTFKKEVQEISIHLRNAKAESESLESELASSSFEERPKKQLNVRMFDDSFSSSASRCDREVLNMRESQAAEEEEERKRGVPIIIDLLRMIRLELEDLGNTTKEKTDDMLKELAQLKSDVQLSLKSNNEVFDKQ